MSGGGKGGSSAADTSNAIAQQAQQTEAARQAAIASGTNSVNKTFDSQFTPAYYDAQRDDYTAYAEPQLTDQFNNATRQLTYSLDRAGNLNSSTRGFQASQLQKLYDTNDQKIKADAVAQANTDKSNVEAAREGLIDTLNSTGDATGAANAAVSRASTLAAPQPYSPLANLFADFTNTLGTQAAAARAYAYSGGAMPSYSPALFGVPSNSTVVN